MIFLASTALAWFPSAVSGQTNQPHWLEVLVVNKQTGEPISGAAVCLGTAARSDQFGAGRADDKGLVRFEALPRNPLVLTVSGTGFQGRTQQLGALYQSRVLELKIAPGGGGPQCSVPPEPAVASTSSGLSIKSLSVRADPESEANGVLVSVSVSGEANQIRVSEQPDFGGASWQALQLPLAYTLSQGKGKKQLYVQVRRFAGAEGASMEVVSQIQKVGYRAN